MDQNVKLNKLDMKTIFFLLATMCCIHSFGQVKNLNEMNETARNKYLIKLAKEVTKNFGPEWYRKNLRPEVTDTLAVYYTSNTDSIYACNNGRCYYRVTLYYDDATKKDLLYSKASMIDIWADNGEPRAVFFGHNYGLSFNHIPYKSRVKAGVTKEEQIPFKKVVIPLSNDENVIFIPCY